MADLEKVIKGLECCKQSSQYEYVDSCDARGCPYLNIGDCIETLCKDALELLKEQMPRVMTADDIALIKTGDVLVLEQRNPNAIVNAILVQSISHDGYDDEHIIEVLQVVTAYTVGEANLGCDYYNKTWRCWTSRPTDEQRKAVKWE